MGLAPIWRRLRRKFKVPSPVLLRAWRKRHGAGESLPQTRACTGNAIPCNSTARQGIASDGAGVDKTEAEIAAALEALGGAIAESW